MKNKLYILGTAIILSAILLPGCYKLERIPEDKLSPAIFWKTPEQAKQAIAACYSALNQGEVYNTLFGMPCLIWL